MADIKQAAQWMKEGKRVVRAESLQDGDTDAAVWLNDLECLRDKQSECRAVIHVDDLLADDWVVAPDQWVQVLS